MWRIAWVRLAGLSAIGLLGVIGLLGGDPAPAGPAVLDAAPATMLGRALEVPLDRKDPLLQHRLEAAVRAAGGEAIARRGKLAVALVDLGSPGRERYAGLNDDRMMYAASLPKIGALLTAFDLMEAGRLADTPSLREDLTEMIRHSSNAAATRVIRLVGFDEIAGCLGRSGYGLYDVRGSGGLWVGKAYDGVPAAYRDPIGGFSHGATARQAARFFVLLDRGLLVSPERSLEMKRILSRPGISHKFVKGLEGFPDVRIYRKSGTFQNWHADAALVERGSRRYVAVALVEDRGGGRLLERLILELDAAVTPGRPAGRP